MRINTNISAMNTYSRLTGANAQKSGSLAKLSSGLRINNASDDAAGLSISEKMKNQVSGMTQAMRNAQDGISLIQTAEGGLNEIHNVLNRMRDLSVQAANDTNTPEDRKAIETELGELQGEIDRIAESTSFNKQNLLADENVTFNIQVGANTTATVDAITIQGLNVKFAELVESPAPDPAPAGWVAADLTHASAQTNIKYLDTAIEIVSENRATLGAQQNRLDHTIANLSVSKENLAEANSRIRDVDMAEEMMEFTKANILSQASTAMLAQANQMPQGVLQLLQ